MEHTQRAIELAIEGGWKYKGNQKTDETLRGQDVKVYLNDENDTKLYIGFNEFFLDPLFWQSLGKSLGWEDRKPYAGAQYPSALVIWHKFIEHLWCGESADSFFAGLLN